MKWVPLPLCLLLINSAFAQETPGQLSAAQQQFRNALAARVATLEKENSAIAVGSDGWFFLSASLRFLSLGKFWGAEASSVSRARNPRWADPLPAILDFDRQLRERGIHLLLVPVPPKAAIYPHKALRDPAWREIDCAPYLHLFYDELRANNIDVLDLTNLFLQHRDDPNGPVFCKTDSHWSGIGCALASDPIAEKIKSSPIVPAETSKLNAAWKEVSISGDLEHLFQNSRASPHGEKILLRQITDQSGKAVSSDANSPVLLLGDSHVLVYHDFLAERGGILDQLAYDLGYAPDVLGTRGSGATPVRISLRRRNLADQAYLGKKRVVVWCFSAREFTEAEDGWAPVPLSQ